MKFAFIVHPLGMVTQQLNAIQPSPKLRATWGTDLPGFCRQLQDEIELARERLMSPRGAAVRVIDELPNLVSITGAIASGRFYEIPQTPEELLADPSAAADSVLEAIRQAAAWGAEIAGLGALTGTLGAGGALIAEAAPIAVTTGNSLTVYAAVRNVLAVARELEIDLADETIAILGAPGSIAAAAAKWLAPHVGRVMLVARGASPRLQRLAEELHAEVRTSIPEAVREVRLIVSATSSGMCLDPAWLQPGTVVWDVAVPADVIPTATPRADLLILSGGLTALPPGDADRGGYLWLHRGVIPSCLGETLLLAYEGHRENYSLGRQLDLGRIEEIGTLSARHGFDFTRKFVEGLPLEDSAWVTFRQHRHRAVGRRANSRPVSSKPATHPRDDGVHEAQRQFARHLNPVLSRLLEHSDLVQTFVRGEGTRLYDAAGREYLDFVAGFGSVNLGHQHPRIVAALHEAMRQQGPGFIPGHVNPWAARLAERLVLSAPPGLELVTFVNSGTEAVEAALKLARAATGRTRILSLERGYHGKTLGALSVTAHGDYRVPFEPLVPECQRLPWGDLGALQQALADHRAAAFLVEPVAAEGGMYPLPVGYLTQAQALCRAAGTLLIVDEVQTGLGRTGALYAVDHVRITPDVMCLSKSLGGGLMPIGATLCRRPVWDRAYGTIDRCLLHTSTFGGGTLACAAALATLDVLEDEALPARAATLGTELLTSLRRLVDRYPVLHEARGQGLLIGLEFAPLPEMIARHWAQQAGLLPDLLPNLEAKLAGLPAFYVMQSLLRKHAIVTQVCRSNPAVLRIEPPLTVTAEEVRRFVNALEAAVAEIELTNLMFATCLSKTARGELDWRQDPG